MNKYQKRLKSYIKCMPDIIPITERKKIALEAIKQPINNNFSIITRHTRKYIWNLVENKRIRHWCETYPHHIVASAIVDKNNILHNWKVGENSYEEYFIHEGYQVKVKIWCVNNNKEHESAFNTLSKKWFKDFKVAEGYKGMLPY